jgi:uncharacterized membrane protein YkvA (DUF1232 family)
VLDPRIVRFGYVRSVFGLAGVGSVLIAVAAALLIAWVGLVVMLLAFRPKGSVLKEAFRILPDTVRLLRRIAADRTVPRRVRIRIYALLAYLAFPIDLIPDFLPVVGYADDAVIVAAVLRSVTRRAGADTIRRHWVGTDEGLVALSRIAGLPLPS